MLLMPMNLQNLVKILLFMFNMLNGNEILTSFKGRNFVTNWRKWTLNNHKLDVVNIKAYPKFVQNQFIRSQDIERNRNSDVIQGP